MSDLAVRFAAFRFLEHETARAGESATLRRSILERGFDFDGQRVPLVGPKGIFKPKVLAEVPLSITTKAVTAGQTRPYEDLLGQDGLLRYRYRGTDPLHPDNIGLRLALERRRPLIYFHGVVPGLYAAAWPVYVVGDEPRSLSFVVTVDERTIAGLGSVVDDADEPPGDANEAPIRRKYATRLFKQRVHQAGFRERVVRAYHYHCAICRLKRQELIEAAHILPDSDPLGEPRIANGIALCKLHHSAFDANLIGITPDCVVIVRADVLRETDGPMLIHGLQGFHERSIVVPRNPQWRPDPELLQERYARFQQSSLR